jgi:hypothetical protein
MFMPMELHAIPTVLVLTNYAGDCSLNSKNNSIQDTNSKTYYAI